MYTEITRCRICKSENLVVVLNLGEQALSGVFSKPGEMVEKGPLKLVWCKDCGLLQLKETYSLPDMYGDNYGYRSGLNSSMVAHLSNKIRKLEQLVNLKSTDLVIDIGSNDATSLKAYLTPCQKLGIDPTGKKFEKYYPADVDLLPDFFSAEAYNMFYAGSKAKIITSIAMFYDLPDPAQFVKDVYSILADDGIWHFEVAYMPTMLANCAYDAICHEHLEFYSLTVLNNLLTKCGFKILRAEFNNINGGSIEVTVCKNTSRTWHVGRILQEEKERGFDTIKPYVDFQDRVQRHRTALTNLVSKLNEQGKLVFGFGASTKGNVMLQYCKFTPDDIPFIADVNPDKFGCVTPGTGIPIISEDEARAMKPDYFLVFPWHFRENILQNRGDFKGKFIFPLPEIDVI